MILLLDIKINQKELKLFFKSHKNDMNIYRIYVTTV